ncbi:MAG: hypothetical protein QS98_C0011G0063 [archaeon GW2011_AR3]|nr:MAG: hypothetical protein QS98_C0011G0063 [archaeon GW2011_AR3]MBS3109674.1 glycosyltransferase family 39 protein [Candidatus Woesearchaeota archaeon]
MAKGNGRKAGNQLAFYIFIVFGLIFSIVSINGFGLEFSDQNIYIYMGRLITEGSMPYRDFFFSHPPGEVYLDALIYAIFGFRLWAFKLLSLFAVLASAWYIYKIGEKHIGDGIGLLGSGLFLMTYETLRISAGNIGMAWTVMLSVAGLYYLLQGKIDGNNYMALLSGILAGLAALFTMHAIPVAIGLAVVAMIEISFSKLRLKVRRFAFYLIGFLATFGLISLLFLAMPGSSYYDQVIAYHLQKAAAPVSGIKLGLFWMMAKFNFLVFIGAALGIAIRDRKTSADSSQNRGLFPYVTLIAVYAVYLLLLKRWFPYYFFGAFPFLALLGAAGIAAIASRLKAGMKIAFWAMAILFLANIAFAASQYNWSMDNTFGGKGQGDLARLEQHVSSEDAIYGDYLFAPILALRQGSRIVGNNVDTNPLRFETGNIEMAKEMQALKEAGVVYIVLRKSNEFMLNNQAGADYLDAANCTILENFEYYLPSYFAKQLATDRLFLLRCGEGPKDAQ